MLSVSEITKKFDEDYNTNNMYDNATNSLKIYDKILSFYDLQNKIIDQLSVAFSKLYNKVDEIQSFAYDREKNPDFWLNKYVKLDLEDITKAKITKNHNLNMSFGTYQYQLSVNLNKTLQTKSVSKSFMVYFNFSMLNTIKEYINEKKIPLEIKDNSTSKKITRIYDISNISWLNEIGMLCMGNCIHRCSFEMDDGSTLEVEYVDKEQIMEICDNIGQNYPKHITGIIKEQHSFDEVKNESDKTVFSLYCDEYKNNDYRWKKLIINDSDEAKFKESCCNYILWLYRNNTMSEDCMECKSFYDDFIIEINKSINIQIEYLSSANNYTSDCVVDLIGYGDFSPKEFIIRKTNDIIDQNFTSEKSLEKYIPSRSLDKVMDTNRDLSDYPEWYINQMYEEFIQDSPSDDFNERVRFLKIQYYEDEDHPETYDHTKMSQSVRDKIKKRNDEYFIKNKEEKLQEIKEYNEYKQMLESKK